MNILNKFTLKSLSKNRKRTIVTIIGISLSTALICAVAGMYMSLRKTLVDMAKIEEGNYHILFENVQKDELKYIENNVKVSSCLYSKNIGYSLLDGIKNEDKPYVFVLGCDNDFLHNAGFRLTEGRFPENDSEVTISSHLMSNGRVTLKVGDVLKLNIGDRQTIDGESLYQNNPFEKYDEEYPIDENLVNTTYKEFKIVGIMERPGGNIETYTAPGYTIVTYLNNEQINNLDGYTNIAVSLKNPSSRQEKVDFVNDIKNIISQNEDSIISIKENQTLLTYEGNLSDSTMRSFVSIVAVIIGIVIVSSVFVIRNSFSISVAEKNKEYGMMASIGATSKQIRKSVLFEAFMYGIIGIPLGIIIGIIAVAVLVILLNILLKDSLNYGFKFLYGIPVSVIFVTTALSALTIYLSAIIPAIKAAKTTPIDAIKNNEKLQIKPKKLRTSKLTKKVFGMGGVISSKNLKRSKKKYRTTVISLVVSVSIFIALSSFIEYGMKMTGRYANNTNCNIMFDLDTMYGNNLFSREYNDDKLNIFKEVIEKYNLDNYSYNYSDSVDLDINEYGTDEYKNYRQKMKVTGDMVSPTIEKINKEEFERYIKSLGINGNSKEVVVLSDALPPYTELKGYAYNIKEGQTITVYQNDTPIKVHITKRADQGPMGFGNNAYSYGQIFISEENDLFDKNGNFNLSPTLYIQTDDADKLESDLNDLISSDSRFSGANVYNIEADARASERVVLIISIFLYGFIIVITLIGVTNIFNTITTNMILRSKEFAMLKSVGMTSREFNRMIRLESIMYGLKSLMIGIPIGIALTYLIYHTFSMEIDFGFIIPVKAIFIAFVFVFIIVGLTMKYSLNKINKQNIVETIRNDNI